MDYMGTFQTYPRITDYQDTNTHERVTRVHTWMRVKRFMNVILERKAPYIKPIINYTIIGLYIVLYYIVYIGLYHNRIISMYPR